MTYRPRRHQSLPQTLCEQFTEQQVVIFFRTYLPLGGPNFDNGPVIERATHFVVYIDLLREDTNFRTAFFAMLQNGTSANTMVAAIFQDCELAPLLKILAEVQWAGDDHLATSRADKLGFYARDPAMVDQLIWGITHPNESHPGVCRDIEDTFLVAVLLIRHFKYHGGLVLPPLQAARSKRTAHEILVASEKATGRSTEYLFMYYHNWRDSRGLAKPPGLGGPLRVAMTASVSTSGSEGRAMGGGRCLPKPSRFGAIGESLPRW